VARIGVQAMMLRECVEERGVFETLSRVRAIGYGAVEVSQIPMNVENVVELVRARDELGMDIASISAVMEPSGGTDSLHTDFDKIVADAHAVGCEMVRIGMMPLPALASLELVEQFCDSAERMAVRLSAEGIRLYYHNHHVEFAKYDGRYILDILAERSPSVGLELDVHWLQRGGVDPQRTIERFSGRVAMVHLKDYRIGALPPEAFGKLERGERDAFMTDFVNTVQFAEVGEGNLDWTGIIPAAVGAGAAYLLVEQDLLYGRDVFDCLQTSYDNLVALGFGRLF